METWQALSKVREGAPLVQCITNFVSMDFMANCLLAASASPAMVHSTEEVEDFVAVASALLVNVGTLSPDWVAAMKLCAKKAVELKKPWVLDPVACGATPYRTAAVQALAACSPTVIRGNAGEILALAGVAGSTKGADSLAGVSEAEDAARKLALQFSTVIAVSGAVDFVTDGSRWARVSNGTPMLTKITAAGCAVTAVIAAFVAVSPQDIVMAVAHALAYFGLAGETALANAAKKGPGSVRVGLLDELYLLNQEAVVAGARIEQGSF